MAVLLKQIPALEKGGHRHHPSKSRSSSTSSTVEGLHVLDSMFIWTEPNSMRMRLAITLRADINEAPRTVSIQQRVKVTFKVQWQQCPDCQKESRERTWQAIVQLRQKRSADSARKGLLILEMAIARNADMRKNILTVQTKKNGFDFYFSALDKARHFAAYLGRAAPMRVKASRSLVSEDKTNNTANIRHTVSCDMVPLCRDDLVIADKHTSKKGGVGLGRLSGRLCLVLKMSSVVHVVDASPPRGANSMENCLADLHAENYWKGGGEKAYRVLCSADRLVRFVVLDVELCGEDRRKGNVGGGGGGNGGGKTKAGGNIYKGPQSGVSKYALADVEVARESDLGANDETFRCVTHLGHLLNVGDVVLGYSLASTVLSGEGEWSLENAFHSNFSMPDVVLVRKIKGSGGGGGGDGGGDNGGTEAVASEVPTKSKGKEKAKSSANKKRERRNKKEEKKQKALAEVGDRMGLFKDDKKNAGKKARNRNGGNGDDDDEDGEDDYEEIVVREKAALEKLVEEDDELAEDLELIERELAHVGITVGGDDGAAAAEEGGDEEDQKVGQEVEHNVAGSTETKQDATSED